ncbi:ArnT family glycosyltransferase [Schlesneria sp.]|uniref:ArnT family glycosyltransferase n=1 Tax=Schlesneria sp. TaxID=2762018 RepID=UPI002EEEA8BE
MSEATPRPTDPEQQPRWWTERELLLILFLIGITFCVRLDALPLFGEEPRRAQIAREMVESGDWLVPGTQRVFLPSRPPLQNWLIAFVGLMTGAFDVWSARIPSVISVALIAVMMYGYLRQYIGRLGSLTGVASFLTMTLVMEFGRSAETEAVFSLFVAASMLLWHWGWMKKWPEWQLWSIGYFFTAMGMLTKGLQAPLYFVGATTLFLLATNNWRKIVTWPHILGISVFIVTVGAWQGPFAWYRGIEDSWNIYFGDVAGRFVDRHWGVFLGHLVTFPAELLFVRLMPWSLLLLAYGSRRVRQLSGVQREGALFLAICIGFSFISVWLPPGSKVRYYMPLFPCFAALIGIAVDRLAALRPTLDPDNAWTNYVQSMVYLMTGSAVVVVAVSMLFPAMRIALSVVNALGYAAAALALAYIAWSSLKDLSERGMGRGVMSIATFLALVEVCLIVTVQERRCEDIAGQLEQLKQSLPADSQLVSLGPVHHAFAYFYEEPIPIVTIPEGDGDDDYDYFCLHTCDSDPPELPFEWTQIAVISCDRLKGRDTPKDRVFVGRRVSTDEQLGQTPHEPALPLNLFENLTRVIHRN